jgi:hypothetical protein
MKYSIAIVAELPPSIAFMLSEFPDNELAFADVRKRFSDRAFVKDFYDQCLAGISTFEYADRQEARFDKFDVYAGHSLDPLSDLSKCGEFACRIAYAHQFARTACLYADRVVISDPFTFTVEATHDEIFRSLAILKVLKPLMEAGVIVFGPAAYLSCGHCTKLTGAAEKQVTSQLWHEFTRADPDVCRYKDGRRWRLSFGSPLFRNAGVGYRITFPATREAVAASRPNTILAGENATELVRQYRKGLRGHFAQCAHGVVFSTNLGSMCKSTVATSTREEAMGYRLLDSRKVGSTLSEWSMLRTVPLPALQQLTASQALRVREEAEKAMPAFRAKLQRDLMSLNDISDEGEEKRALEVAAELRVASRELQGQLAAVKLRSIRRSEKLFAGLAIALELVALSTGKTPVTTAASGAFVALMLAAHKSHRDRQEKHEVLVHQPAYVLIAAERIHAMKH